MGATPPLPAKPHAELYRLDLFRDLAIPAGFVPKGGYDHIAYANPQGQLRVLNTVLIEHQAREQDWMTHFSQPAEALTAWINERLSSKAGSWHHPQLQEQVLISTGREAGRTTIRIVLRHQALY